MLKAAWLKHFSGVLTLSLPPGSLATAGFGTALGVIRALHEQGKLEHAFCTETRPYNQGGEMIAKELVTFHRTSRRTPKPQTCTIDIIDAVRCYIHDAAAPRRPPHCL